MTKLISLCILAIIFFGSALAQPPEFGKDWDAFIRQQVTEGFSGSVLVVRGNKIVLEQSYGNAASIKPEPAFWIASNSKSFVAVAILKLQEQGKLSVKDPISKFLPNVPADKQSITIHHLLTHTSGLPHVYAADGIADRAKAIEALLATPLRWKIGEGYHYSGDGYSLLAAIVEIASGRTFEDYLQREILQPAGLKNTGFWGFEKAPIAAVANPASTSSVGPNIYKDGRSVANWGYRGASGMYSTTRDLYRWMTGLRDGKVLKAAGVTELWRNHIAMQKIDPDEELFYGYGWGGRTKAGKRLYVRHTGNEDWLGHNGVMTLFENGDATVVMTNSGMKGESSWSGTVAREIHRRLQS